MVMILKSFVLIEKEPFASALTPFLVPFSKTEAPERAFPLSSTTFPVIVVVWANPVAKTKRKAHKLISSFFLMLLILGK